MKNNTLILIVMLILFSCQSNDASKTKSDDNHSTIINEKLIDRSLETPSDSALYKNPDLPVMDRVRDLISYMTMDEKIGQMTQVERKFLDGDENISKYFLGSLLSGGGSAPTVAQIRAEMDSNSTKLADIVADTNELQTDWVNGGRLDLIIDNILTDTAVIGSAGAGLSAIPWNSAWDSEVQSECADALTAYDPPTKAEMDATWTTAQAESYASDGAAATPAQLLYMIYCCVGEFSISGTTITGKKLNGSDTAMTWTISDASNPTSRTRAS